MFDLTSLRGKGKDDQMNKFLDILVATKRLIYSWDQDVVWVWAGEAEYPVEADTTVVWGEDLHSVLYDNGCAHDWPTSAGFVVDLLSCGFKIQMAIEEPKEAAFISDLLEGARVHNPLVTLGTIEQFVPKYKSD